MVLVFYAGFTGFRLFDSTEFLVLIGDHNIPRFTIKAWNIAMKVFVKNDTIKSYANFEVSNECCSEAINQHCLLVLIASCAEAKSVKACRTLSRSNLFPKDCCCVDIAIYLIQLSLRICWLHYHIALLILVKTGWYSVIKFLTIMTL